MSIAQNIMRNRVDKLGVSEPEVRKQGADQIVIQLAGVHDTRAAAALIGKTAQLEFYDLENDLTGPSKSVQGQPNPGAEHLLAALRPAGAGQGQGRERVVPLRQEDEEADRRACGVERDALCNTKPAKKRNITHWSRHGTTGKKPKYVSPSACPRDTVVVSCGTDASSAPASDGPPTTTTWYLFKYDPENKDQPGPRAHGRGSEALRNARRPRPEPGPGRPDGLHRRRQQEVPEDHARPLPARQASLSSAAALRDRARPPDQVVPADRLHRQLARQRHQRQRADHRARLVQRGEEPRARPPDRARCRTSSATLESTNVSATLGKDSLQQAKRAAIGGLIAVVIFLLLLYRFMGIDRGARPRHLRGAAVRRDPPAQRDADAAGIRRADPHDRRRRRRERRHLRAHQGRGAAGKSVRAAINAGYSKGLHTILDANAVTCITALVLFAVATAGVKGFALMLLIGTVLSLLTAVSATRAMLGLLAGFRWFDNPTLHGRDGTQGLKFLHIDFMRPAQPLVHDLRRDPRDQRRLARRERPEPRHRLQGRNADHVHDAEGRADRRRPRQDAGSASGDAVVQGRGTPTGGDVVQRSRSARRALPRPSSRSCSARSRTRCSAKAFGVKNVSSSFGRQIAKDAIFAVFFSLVPRRRSTWRSGST